MDQPNRQASVSDETPPTLGVPAQAETPVMGVLQTDGPPSNIDSAILVGSLEQPIKPLDDIPPPPSIRRRRLILYAGLGLILIAGAALVLIAQHRPIPNTTLNSVDNKYGTLHVPLSSVGDSSQDQTALPGLVSINGQLNVKSSLVLGPSTQPASPLTGELYFDQTTNQLFYYDGTRFVSVLSSANAPATPQTLSAGTGLALAGGVLSSTGVLSLQGSTGNVTLTGGNGLAVNGTTFTNTGVLSLGTATGDITVGPGLAVNGNQLKNSGIISATGSGSVTVTNDGNGNIVIDSPVGSGGGGGTVSSPNGTAGKIAKFTGSQTIADSLLSESGSTVTVAGNLTATGTISAASLSGNGASITNVNASQLGGQSGSYYTNATNINSGTLSDGRLSSNVALQSGNNNFTGTLQHSGNNVCDTSGNCTGVAGGGIGGGGTVNKVALFTGSGYTVGNSLLSQDVGATTVTISGGLNVSGAVIATSFSGNGSALTSVDAATLSGQAATYYTNASNLSSGTVADSRLSANVALLTANDNFTGTLQHNGNAVCDVSGNCVGSGAGGAIGGSGTANTIAMFTSSGFTVGNSLLSQNVGATTVTVAGNVTATGTVSAASLSGNGASVTNVNASQLGGQSSGYYTNASNLSSGTVADGRLSTNVTLQGNTFNGVNQLVQLTAGGLLPVLNGSNLTNLNASNIGSGTLADGRLSSNVALQTGNNNFTGTLQHNGNNICDTSGNCVGGGGGVTTPGGTANTFTIFTGAQTVGNSILSQNAGATTVTVAGNLTATGTITAGSLIGDGSGVTSVNAAQLSGQSASYYTNASNLSAGTLADGRLSNNVALYNNALSNFGGVLQQNGNTVCDTSGNCVGSSGGGIGGGGTANKVALFTGSGFTVGNSLLSQDVGATTVTINGNVNITGTTLKHNGYDVCDTSGNCVGGGGGVTTPGGTANTFSIFTGSQTINNSILSQDVGATTITVAGGLTATGAISAASLSGNGSGVTNVNATQLNSQSASYYTNASNLSAGTVADGRLSTNVTLQGNTFNGANQLVQLTAGGLLPVLNGSNLTNLNAANVSSGTLADGRLSTNVALQSGNNNFTGTLQHSGNNVCDTSGNCTGVAGGGVGGGGTVNKVALFTGSGYTVGNSLLSQDVGATTISVAGNLSATGTISAASFSGDGSAVTNVNAAQLGGQSSSYYTNASNIATGTLSDGRLSTNVTLQGNTFNGASQLVQLTAGGLLPVLNGSNLSNLNASNIASGTLADGRLSSNVALQSGNNNFTGTLQHNGNNVCDVSGNCTGVAGGGIGGSGTANKVAIFTGSGYTVGNSIIAQDSGATTVTVTGSLTATGTISAASLSGDGSSVTNVNAAQLGGQTGSYYTNATNLSSGTVATGRLSGSYTGITGVGSLTTGSIGTGFGAISTTNGISTTGTIQGGTVSATTGFSYNGTSGASLTCSGGQLLQNQVVQGGIVTGGSCVAAGTGGITTMGALDGGTANATGATISGSTLFLQSASGTYAGLVNTGTQSFAGDKTFTGNLGTSGVLTATGTGNSSIAGNLGIGTLTPGANLDIQSAATNTSAVNITTNSLTTGNALSISQTETTGSSTTNSGSLINATRSITANAAAGALTLDSTSNGATNGSIATSLSWGQTVSPNSDRYLLVFASTLSGATPTTVTYNGVAMTLLGSQSSGSSSAFIYGLAAPATGTHNVVFTVPSSTKLLGVSESWFNVNQSTPVGTLVGTTGSATSVTQSTVSSTGQTIVDFFNVNNWSGGTISQGSGQTLAASNRSSTDFMNSVSSYKSATGATTSMTMSYSNGPWVYAVLPLNPAVAPGPVLTGAVANLSSTCSIVQGTCTDSSNILRLNQQYSGSTGAVASLQNAGSGDMIDFLNGSGSTVTSLSSAGNFLTTGTMSLKNTSATAFSVQNASSVSYFNVDTSSGILTLGNAASGNYITIDSNGLTAHGTARHTKVITLTPEYAGAILDAAGDSTCSSATNGTMTSGIDNVNYMGYYNWTSSATSQCYDVVVRVPVPSDFSGWSSSTPLTIQTYSSDITNGSVNLQVSDTSNVIESGCTYVNATPGSSNTWAGASGCTLGGTYQSGKVLIVRIRMTSSANSNVRIGDITLSYKTQS